MFWKKKKQYRLRAKKDITAYELSLLVPFYFPSDVAKLEKLPKECLRHLEEIKWIGLIKRK